MGIPQPVTQQRYSVQEYFDLLDSSHEKWEFFDGEVFAWQAMAGTTDPHSAISSNASREFGNAFIRENKPCVSLDSDALLAIPKLRRYRFPDVTIQCGDPVYDTEGGRGRTNPTLIIEVMSESSRQADQGPKFVQYTGIRSLRDYVLIEQEYPLLILYSRDHFDEAWRTTSHTQLADTIRFPSVGVSIPLGEIYRNIVWEAGEVLLRPGAGIGAQPEEK